MKKNLKGFTLVEMLIVISIIAILSGAILAGMGSSRSKARNAKTVSNINTLQLIMENAYTDTLGYPATIAKITDASDLNKATKITATANKITYCPGPADGTTHKITTYRIEGILEKGADADDLATSSLVGPISPCSCPLVAGTSLNTHYCVGN